MDSEHLIANYEATHESTPESRKIIATLRGVISATDDLVALADTPVTNTRAIEIAKANRARRNS